MRGRRREPLVPLWTEGTQKKAVGYKPITAPIIAEAELVATRTPYLGQGRRAFFSAVL